MQIKILVVDDSATDRLIIKNMLSDYNVLTACEGLEAMRMIKEHTDINILILDMNMPDMNGFEVLDAIKKHELNRKLRTIILTNYDELKNEIKGLSMGAVDFIRKPIHMHSLRARIDVHAALLRAEQAIEQKLNEQALTFETIFDKSPIGITISHNCDPKNPDNASVKINSRFEQITGRSKDELIRLGWANITHPDDLEEDIKNFNKLLSGETKMYSMDKRYIKPDGSFVWVHMIVASLSLSNGRQCSHICLVQDITKQKEIEKALNESERSKSVLLSHLPGLAYRCNYDRDWTMQYVSEGCLNLTGYPPESLLYNRDLSYNDIISPEYRVLLWKEWEHVLAARKPFKYEYEIITATGERKWVLEMGQGIYNDEGKVEALEGIVLDISARKAIENTLKYNNEHDRWTGLYNREYLVSLLEKDARTKKESKKALIGINLSVVQLLAANYGFRYSQKLIMKAAEALRQHCNDNRLIFQAGENRFIFYLPNYKDKNELLDFSSVISDTLRSLFVTDRISGGIGVLEIDPNQSELNADLLLRRLLIASERSISMFGKEFELCFYNENLEAAVNRDRDITKALSDIASDDNAKSELFLQYQPIIDLRKGTVFGFEALARLKTEKLGLVSPIEFIPIAEKTKLILPIGEKVILQAFTFLNKLMGLGYDDITVTVNISIIQLLSPDFSSRLVDLINRMKVDQKNIGIEITESVFASDYDIINKNLKKLREVGLYIAIDDFGTGHSSLARENSLKVDCMKIDKYFIDKLLSKDLKDAITGDIISIAHKLGQYTIAEGVEHDSQLHYLIEHNCDRIQGFLISEPLDEEDAIEFLENQDILRLKLAN